MSKTKGSPAPRRERNTTTVEFDEEAAAFLEEYVKGRGASKKSVLSRLIRWFAHQPGPVKDLVQGWVSDQSLMTHSALLRQMAEDLEKKAKALAAIESGKATKSQQMLDADNDGKKK